MRGLTKAVLVLSMGCSILLFQNCSRLGTNGIAVGNASSSSLVSGSNPDVPDLTAPSMPATSTNGSDDNGNNSSAPVVSTPPSSTPVSSQPAIDGSNKTSDSACSAALSGKSVIAYDSIAAAGSTEQNFSISAMVPTINYETIGRVSNGAAQSLTVQARSISEVSSFAIGNLNLNAQSIGKITGFSAALVTAVAHNINEASQFAAVLCVSAQSIQSFHDLASQMTVYGRSENGVKASISDIHSMAAFTSFHDIDVTSISQGAINARFENSHIGKISQGSGEIYLVNSTIDTIDNYAGTVYLIGNSSVTNSPVSSAVTIVKK